MKHLMLVRYSFYYKNVFLKFFNVLLFYLFIIFITKSPVCPNIGPKPPYPPSILRSWQFFSPDSAKESSYRSSLRSLIIDPSSLAEEEKRTVSSANLRLVNLLSPTTMPFPSQLAASVPKISSKVAAKSFRERGSPCLTSLSMEKNGPGLCNLMTAVLLWYIFCNSCMYVGCSWICFWSAWKI